MNSYISLKSWTIRLGRAAAAIVASRDFDWAALQAVGGIMICARIAVRAVLASDHRTTRSTLRVH